MSRRSFRDQSSLLHWTRNMIALRKLFQVFGRGTLSFLHPENRKILAYLRDLEREDGSHETVLCVANLSRFAQPVLLDLAGFAGAVPVEMLGYVPFPPITENQYPLTVAPYSFLWFELQPAPDKPLPAALPTAKDPVEEAFEQVALQLLTKGWGSLTNGPGLGLLQAKLPAWLGRQRWFGAKTRPIAGVRVADFVALPVSSTISEHSAAGQTSHTPDPRALGAALFFIEVKYIEGEPDTYQIPLALSSGRELEGITANAPLSVIAPLTTPSGPAVLHDATVREDLRQSLLRLIEDRWTLQSGNATFAGSTSSAFTEVRGAEPLPARISSAEQSNTNIFYDAKMLMKLFRRIQPGQNPDVEIGRFLTEVAHYPRIATFLGEITATDEMETTTTAMLQELVANEGDGWQFTLDELARFYESVMTCPPPASEGEASTLVSDGVVPQEAQEHAGLYLEAAALLGRRTAELHLALAIETDNQAFAAEPFTEEDLASDARRIERQISKTLEALRGGMSGLHDLTSDAAATLLSRRLELFARAQAITSAEAAGKRIRIHGDYHLGQVLRAKNDFVLLDFEGEPARSLEERRRKQSPLKDVAGMLRSFSYAAYSALDLVQQRRPDSARALEPWARLWEKAVCTVFLNAYKQTTAADPGLLPEPAQAQALLNAYLLEKALYELLYELNNRPTWVRIPLSGILALPR